MADKELVQEIPLRPHHLNPVIPGFPRPGGGGDNVGDLLVYPRLIQFAGGKG